MPIIGRLRDIQPKQSRPTLELYFDERYRRALPKGERAGIDIEINDVVWHATLNSANSNPPYVHAGFLALDGRRSSCTQIFLDLGLAERAELEFEQRGPDKLTLVRVKSAGEWRPGNAPCERSSSRAHPASAESRARQAGDRPTRTVDSFSTAFPFDNRDEILSLADQYWSLISSRDVEEERAFEREMPAVRREGFLSKDLFVRLARWKSVRKTPDYLANSEDDIRRATASAFAAETDRAALEALMGLKGVALRTASALLHWMRPEHFPILDYRIVAALGEPEPGSYEDYAYYERTADQVRALATKHGIDLRTIDRALWTWQKLGS